MSDMPEEIWAAMDSHGSAYWCSHRIGEAAKIAGHKNAKGMDEIKYVRFDLHEALKAENEKLREAYTEAQGALAYVYNHILNDTLHFGTPIESIAGLLRVMEGPLRKTISKCGGD